MFYKVQLWYDSINSYPDYNALLSLMSIVSKNNEYTANEKAILHT